MKITIHQPEFFPYLGILAKIKEADFFVIADTFDFKKNYFGNRNKIRTKEGWQYITVPVQKHNHKSFNDVTIDYSHKWQDKMIKSILMNYAHSPNIGYYSYTISALLSKQYESIGEMNKTILKTLLPIFGINTPIVLASELGLNPELRGTDALLEICQKMRADEYISGQSGKDYLDLKKFEDAGIKVTFQDFFHPVYKQAHPGFEAYMSCIDLLFMQRSGINYFGKHKDAINLILDRDIIEDKTVLEMFGGTADGHLTTIMETFPRKLEIWELDPTHVAIIKNNPLYYRAKVLNTNSLIEMTKTDKRYELVSIDHPAIFDLVPLFPEALKLVADEGWVIFPVIRQPYGDNPEYKALREKFYQTENNTDLEFLKKFHYDLFSKDYEILEERHHVREYHNHVDWLYYFAYQLKRK